MTLVPSGLVCVLTLGNLRRPRPLGAGTSAASAGMGGTSGGAAALSFDRADRSFAAFSAAAAAFCSSVFAFFLAAVCFFISLAVFSALPFSALAFDAGFDLFSEAEGEG